MKRVKAFVKIDVSPEDWKEIIGYLKPNYNISVLDKEEYDDGWKN